jgi:hypothetical protein
MAVDLNAALDELFGVDPEAFVEERNRIAGELRKEGRRAEAAQVKELRKPNLSAWTVNQLARAYRKDVDLLLDAGHRLAAAQAEVISGGDPAGFDEARKREQEALKRLRKAAHDVLGDRSSSGTIERVTSTLRAAAVSEEGREQLARGRLTTDVEASGFEAFAGIAIAPTTKAPDRKAKPKDDKRAKGTKEAKTPKGPSRRELVAQARSELAAAREREAEATREARNAAKAVADARKALEAAERAAEAAEADRQAAASETAATERALEAARAASD